MPLMSTILHFKKTWILFSFNQYMLIRPTSLPHKVKLIFVVFDSKIIVFTNKRNSNNIIKKTIINNVLNFNDHITFMEDKIISNSMYPIFVFQKCIYFRIILLFRHIWVENHFLNLRFYGDFTHLLRRK